ncbi:class 3 adenylate cyclase [Bradyrhizobium sp. LM2.7]
MTPSVPGVHRRLAAVLAADVVGYTRLMEAHELDTHTRLMQLRSEVLDPGVAALHGTIVKNTGDGFLATFDTARDATRCALSLQESVAANTAGMPADQRISFRMGLNAADIIVEKDDVYGEGVNIAARLQTYAQAGGIVVSGAIGRAAWQGFRRKRHRSRRSASSQYGSTGSCVCAPPAHATRKACRGSSRGSGAAPIDCRFAVSNESLQP